MFVLFYFSFACLHVCAYAFKFGRFRASLLLHTTCVRSFHCICIYALTIPPSHTLPYYPQTQHPPCPRSQFTTIGGDSTPRSWACGSETYDWRAAALFLHAHCYLHHGPPRPHTWPRIHTTASHATTLHSHCLPTSSLAPLFHLIAMSILAINCLCAHLGLS